MAIEKDNIYNMDCIEGMKMIPDNSIDCIICDLPYGTTRNAWDSVIPLDALWAEYKRIAKPNAAIVLFAQTPFDKVLGASNLPMLRYEWIWQKDSGTGFLNAKKMPLKFHENILVFYQEMPTYNPQGLVYNPKVQRRGGSSFGKNYGNAETQNYAEYENYPRDIIVSNHDKNTFHPTQKPLDLLRYLVLTYSNEGDTILDNTCGSGTTCVAAYKEHRHYIGFELNKEYYDKALQRINRERQQLSLF